MPRQRSTKYIFVEAVVFIGLLALVGHLSVNFWERFFIQSELTQMKTSLHSLKETLAHIGIAYDNLDKELKGLVEITEKKHFPDRYKNIVPDHVCNEKLLYKMLDRRRQHDLQLKAILLAKSKQEEKAKMNKIGENHLCMEDKKVEAKNISPPKNATTITRYPTKSTGVGHKEHELKTCRIEAGCDHHRCYKGYDNCDAHPYNHWKY